MKAELDALEGSAERAGLALACVYSCSAELEAAELAARRIAQPGLRRTIAGLRLIVVATAIAALAALVALATLQF